MFDRRIAFAVELDTGMVYSRVGDQVAVPIPSSYGLRLRGASAPQYSLERFPAYAIRQKWSGLHCTQRIPIRVQNFHREFWRLPKLTPASDVDLGENAFESQADNPRGDPQEKPSQLDSHSHCRSLKPIARESENI